jgi:hypothetical protein
VAWNYTVSDLATSTKDQIRLEIGDNVAGQTVTLADEEINQAIAMESNMWGAAARCCEMLATQFLRMADVRVGRGGTTLTYSVAAKQYWDRAKALRLKANGTVAPWAGGRLTDDKISLAQDTGSVQPIFTKTVENNPWIGGQTSDSTNDDQDDA